MKKHLFLLYVLLSAALMLFSVSCSSEKTTIVDGDIDEEFTDEIELEFAELEPEPESFESYEQWEEGEYTYDTVKDSVYGQMRVEHFSRFREDVPMTVNTIIKDVNGGAYFGTETGLTRYNPASGHFEAVELPDGLDELSIYDITLDQINIPVVIGRSNQSETLFKVVLNKLVPQSGCDIFDIPTCVTLRDGTTVYIGTSSGLYVFNDVECTKRNDIEGNVTDMDAVYKNQEGLFAVLSRYSTDPDKLWKAEQGVWLDFSEEDGLFDEIHRKVAIYMPEKKIWTISSLGVEYLDRQNTLHGFKAQTGQLPDDDLFNLAVSDSGEIWVANLDEVMRYRPDVSERWDAFYSQRWLQGGEIRSIGFDSEQALWVTHKEGIERFEYLPWTLNDKEAYYRQLMKDRHMRDGKYIGMCSMESSGDLENCAITYNDQDGLYTALYSLAMSFRSATLAQDGDFSAISDAKKAFEHALEIFTAGKENGELGAPATTLVERGAGPVDDEVWFRSDNYDWRGAFVEQLYAGVGGKISPALTPEGFSGLFAASMGVQIMLVPIMAAHGILAKFNQHRMWQNKLLRSFSAESIGNFMRVALGWNTWQGTLASGLMQAFVQCPWMTRVAQEPAGSSPQRGAFLSAIKPVVKTSGEDQAARDAEIAKSADALLKQAQVAGRRWPFLLPLTGKTLVERLPMFLALYFTWAKKPEPFDTYPEEKYYRMIYRALNAENKNSLSAEQMEQYLAMLDVITRDLDPELRDVRANLLVATYAAIEGPHRELIRNFFEDREWLLDHYGISWLGEDDLPPKRKMFAGHYQSKWFRENLISKAREF